MNPSNDQREDTTRHSRPAPPPDLAVQIVNADASVRAWRGSARSVSERMRQFRMAGRVHDETYFARAGQRRTRSPFDELDRRLERLEAAVFTIVGRLDDVEDRAIERIKVAS